MSWFDRFICSCEVDEKNLERPVCAKCGKDIPRVLTTSSGWEVNPKLERWYLRKSLPKLAELFKATRKK